jgi:hypothetical protein
LLFLHFMLKNILIYCWFCSCVFALCGYGQCCRRFGDIYCLHLQGRHKVGNCPSIYRFLSTRPTGKKAGNWWPGQWTGPPVRLLGKVPYKYMNTPQSYTLRPWRWKQHGLPKCRQHCLHPYRAEVQEQSASAINHSGNLKWVTIWTAVHIAGRHAVTWNSGLAIHPDMIHTFRVLSSGI